MQISIDVIKFKKYAYFFFPDMTGRNNLWISITENFRLQSIVYR